MDTAADIIRAAEASAAGLVAMGYEPVRYRMHPLDAELLIAAKHPEKALMRLTTFRGLPVIYDENMRLGSPVAEMRRSKALVKRETSTAKK